MVPGHVGDRSPTALQAGGEGRAEAMRKWVLHPSGPHSGTRHTWARHKVVHWVQGKTPGDREAGSLSRVLLHVALRRSTQDRAASARPLRGIPPPTAEPAVTGTEGAGRQSSGCQRQLPVPLKGREGRRWRPVACATLRVSKHSSVSSRTGATWPSGSHGLGHDGRDRLPPWNRHSPRGQPQVPGPSAPPWKTHLLQCMPNAIRPSRLTPSARPQCVMGLCA